MQGRIQGVLFALLLCPAQAMLPAQTDCSPAALERPYLAGQQMPRFTGCTQTQVQTVIRRLELRATYPSVDDAAPVGTVVMQYPSVGKPVSRQTPITLSISSGIPRVTPTVTPSTNAGNQPGPSSQKQPSPYGGGGTGYNSPTGAGAADKPGKVIPTPVVDNAGPEPASQRPAAVDQALPQEPVPQQPAVALQVRPKPCSKLQISGTLSSGVPHAGRPVVLVFTIQCAVENAPTPVLLSASLVNLQIVRISGACSTPRCAVRLPQNGTLEIDVTARPLAAGTFSYTLNAAPGPRASFLPVWHILTGVAESIVPSWSVWGAGGLLVGIGVASVSARRRLQRHREEQWKRGFRVTAAAGQVTSPTEAVPVHGPAIRIGARLDADSVVAAGAIPIVKEERYGG